MTSLPVYFISHRKDAEYAEMRDAKNCGAGVLE
jgi:hypothetical protein